MSESNLDIYDDLDVPNFAESFQSQEEIVKDLNEKIETLHLRLEQTSKEKDEYKSQWSILCTNISSLLKTAQAEIKRKDKQISELRDEVNSLKRRSEFRNHRVRSDDRRSDDRRSDDRRSDDRRSDDRRSHGRRSDDRRYHDRRSHSSKGTQTSSMENDLKNEKQCNGISNKAKQKEVTSKSNQENRPSNRVCENGNMENEPNKADQRNEVDCKEINVQKKLIPPKMATVYSRRVFEKYIQITDSKPVPEKSSAINEGVPSEKLDGPNKRLGDSANNIEFQSTNSTQDNPGVESFYDKLFSKKYDETEEQKKPSKSVKPTVTNLNCKENKENVTSKLNEDKTKSNKANSIASSNVLMVKPPLNCNNEAVKVVISRNQSATVETINEVSNNPVLEFLKKQTLMMPVIKSISSDASDLNADVTKVQTEPLPDKPVTKELQSSSKILDKPTILVTNNMDTNEYQDNTSPNNAISFDSRNKHNINGHNKNVVNPKPTRWNAQTKRKSCESNVETVKEDNDASKKPKLENPVVTTKNIDNKRDNLMEALFGSPLKWTDNSRDSQPPKPLDVSSPAVYEDSCSAYIENIKFSSTMRNNPPNEEQKQLKEKSGADQVTKEGPKNDFALPSVMQGTKHRPFKNFSSTTTHKNVSIFSPPKVKGDSNLDFGSLTFSLSALEFKTATAPVKNGVRFEDSLMGQFENTTQFISSLTKMETQLSPLNTPCKSGTDAGSQQPVINLNLIEPPPLFKDNENQKPINILQPRKTPRQVSSSSTTKSKETSAAVEVKNDNRATVFALNDCFILQQEKKVLSLKPGEREKVLHVTPPSHNLNRDSSNSQKRNLLSKQLTKSPGNSPDKKSDSFKSKIYFSNVKTKNTNNRTSLEFKRSSAYRRSESETNRNIKNNISVKTCEIKGKTKRDNKAKESFDKMASTNEARKRTKTISAPNKSPGHQGNGNISENVNPQLKWILQPVDIPDDRKPCNSAIINELKNKSFSAIEQIDTFSRMENAKNEPMDLTNRKTPTNSYTTDSNHTTARPSSRNVELTEMNKKRTESRDLKTVSLESDNPMIKPAENDTTSKPVVINDSNNKISETGNRKSTTIPNPVTLPTKVVRRNRRVKFSLETPEHVFIAKRRNCRFSTHTSVFGEP